MSYEEFNPGEYMEKKLVENFEAAKNIPLKNKQPFGILIDGSPGMGKTTNAAIVAKFFQPNFDVEKQIGRGIEQFIKAYNYTIDDVKGQKIKVCVYDEANDSDKSGSRGKVQRILNQVLVATSRQETVIIIVVLHRFYRLDEKFFDNSLIDILLNLNNKVNDKYTHFRAYDIDGMIWMSSQIKRGKVPKKPLVYGITSPNFQGKIKAPPLDFMLEIEKFSKEGKDLLRKKGTKEILLQQYYSVPVLASMLGQTKAAVDYRIKKLGLKKLYLRDKAGKTLFYDKDIFGTLKKIFAKEEEQVLAAAQKASFDKAHKEAQINAKKAASAGEIKSSKAD